MKKQIAVFTLLLASMLLSAQSNCSRFYPFEKGITSVLTSYDKKGKVDYITSYIVKEVATNNNTEVATIVSEVKDDKGEHIVASSYDITCSASGSSIGFNSILSPSLLNQYKDMDYEITGTNIDLPNNLSTNQALPDAFMNMKVSMSGITINMRIDITDRKVVGTESVTTDAGTFECYILSYTSKLKMGMTQTFYNKIWLAEHVGLVKQQTTNKKGKVIGSSALTAFSK